MMMASYCAFAALIAESETFPSECEGRKRTSILTGGCGRNKGDGPEQAGAPRRWAGTTEVCARGRAHRLKSVPRAVAARVGARLYSPGSKKRARKARRGRAGRNTVS